MTYGVKAEKLYLLQLQQNSAGYFRYFVVTGSFLLEKSGLELFAKGM